MRKTGIGSEADLGRGKHYSVGKSCESIQGLLDNRGAAFLRVLCARVGADAPFDSSSYRMTEAAPPFAVFEGWVETPLTPLRF
jgi:hypothetical protein